MSVLEQLMRGSIDMHVHHGPDPVRERSVDALQAALEAEEAGMRAIVLKSHDYPTAPLAHIVGKSVHNLAVCGSICLDWEVGGLNPVALTTSALLGAKVVWMPTLSTLNDRTRHNLGEGGIVITNEKGKIIPVVQELLDIIKAHDMVLCTGHVSVAESFALVDEARRKGLTKIVITHPLEELFGAYLSIDQQKQMADKGAFIEHCFYGTMPAWDGRIEISEIVKAVKSVGADRCILTTDSGQSWNPRPVEGWRMMIADFLKCGLTAEEIELMIKVNPAKLLGLS
ncbi:MAG: hypothetical protein HYX90_07140 [Chloroflexi bacterium]|nr:hypothetical protein [Chloroflexota bacterium]